MWAAAPPATSQAAINDPWWDQRAILMYRDAKFQDFTDHVKIVPVGTNNTNVNIQHPRRVGSQLSCSIQPRAGCLSGHPLEAKVYSYL